MKAALLSWQFWALLSAAFAALTAIFAKVGVENVNSDFATFIRTIVILLVLGGNPDRDRAIPVPHLDFEPELLVSDPVRHGDGWIMDLLFPCAQAGRCGAGRARSTS